MMMEKTMLRFFGSTTMGLHIFKEYQKKASDENLNKVFKELYQKLKSHQQAIKNQLEKLGIDEEPMKISQTLAIKMEKLKIKFAEDDFDLVKLAIKAINIGSIGIMNILHNNPEIPESFKETAKSILLDYDSITKKLKTYAINNGETS